MVGRDDISEIVAWQSAGLRLKLAPIDCTKLGRNFSRPDHDGGR